MYMRDRLGSQSITLLKTKKDIWGIESNENKRVLHSKSLKELRSHPLSLLASQVPGVPEGEPSSASVLLNSYSRFASASSTIQETFCFSIENTASVLLFHD